MNSKQYPVTRRFCNTCLGETNHNVLATREKRTEAEKCPDIVWIDTYQLLECRGCEAVCFGLEEFFSEAVAEDDPGTRVSRYPPPTKRRLPEWSNELPETFRDLLAEVYSACAFDARTLAAMGIRALIDGVANDKVGDNGNFKKKLELLTAGEFLSSYQTEVIDAAFYAGSASMHRAFRPSSDVLTKLLDIVEHLLQCTYVLKRVANDLKKATPKRPKNGGS